MREKDQRTAAAHNTIPWATKLAAHDGVYFGEAIALARSAIAQVAAAQRVPRTKPLHQDLRAVVLMRHVLQFL